MKVLKKGREQKSWARTLNCTGHGNGNGGCKAKLLVEHSDIYKTHSYHYDGSNEVYLTFSCPICNVESDIPKSVSVPNRDKILDEKEFFKKQKKEVDNEN